MAKDPFEALRSKFGDSGVAFDAIGTETDPDDSTEYLVGQVDEGQFDEAAMIAEDEGIDKITTESFGGDLLARFGRDK